MEKLPKNFELDLYGLQVRFVEKEDAGFILKLRTDKVLSKYIHPTENNLEKQREWIREYKKRESRGEDYYFVFSREGIPVGLNRIYSIRDDVFTTGSWIFDRNVPFECVVASALIIRVIAFEIMAMKLENGYDGCHEDNKKVIKFNRMIGLKESGRIQDTKGTYITMTLTKEDFEKNKTKIVNLLNLE